VNQSVFTLTPGGLALGRSLGFTPTAVQVDNYTSSYVTLSDVGRVIPPWTYGAVVPLPEGIRQANAVLTATVPAVAGPPVPVSQVILTWTDQPLPADPGHLLQQSQYGVQTELGTVLATDPVIATKTFTVPAGTQAIGILVDGAQAPVQLVSVVGVTSGNFYLNLTSVDNGEGPQWRSFSVVDTAVTVHLTAFAGQSALVHVLASPLLAAVDISTVVGEVIDVASATSGSTFVVDETHAFGWSVSGTFDGAVAAPSMNEAAPGAGSRLLLRSYSLDVVNTAATAYAGTLAFSDPTTGTFWRRAVAIPATVDSADHVAESGLWLPCATNKALTMALNNALGAGVSVRMNMAGDILTP
jgi:hypothetical protein